MANSSSFLSLALFSSLVFFIATPSLAKTSFRPKALVLPVAKHSPTHQYLTSIKQRTPLVPVRLTLDLGGQFLWVDCQQDYVSSTYKPARCNSAQSSLANSKACTTECNSSPRPGCNNNTCSVLPDNSVIPTAGNGGEVGQDVVSLHSTDGSNPTTLVYVPNFLFACAESFLLDRLASGVKGMAGLGRANIGLPSLFASAFSFKRKLTICLPSSTKSYGAVFFRDGPYNLVPGIDVSTSLTYTPFLLNPINDKVVTSFNTSLLTIDENGYGGTKISTVHPYTVLETSIYNAVVNAFVSELSDVPRVTAIAPFGACFNSTAIVSTRAGLVVPTIDLVLQSENVYWRIFGANSMVQVTKDVVCLGFVDNGQSPSNPRTNTTRKKL
ncbi:hypothetical protein ACLB2K_034997 [Fragaria x ananassa]